MSLSDQIEEWMQSSVFLSPTNITLKNSKRIWKKVLQDHYFQNQQIQKLDLSECTVKDEQIKVINKAKLNSLKQLNLCNIMIYLDSNKVTFKGIKILMSQNWSKLTDLNLNVNKIGNQGCKYLSKINMKQLMYLYLNSSLVGNAGAQYLTKMNTPKLFMLIMGMCKCNEAAEQTIQLHLGKNEWKFLIKLDKYLVYYKFNKCLRLRNSI